MEADLSRQLGSDGVQRAGQRALTEVDDRAPQYMPRLVYAELQPAIAIEEAQPVFARIVADALFANARYCASFHQCRNFRRLNVQQLAEQHGVDHDIAVGDFDLRDAIVHNHPGVSSAFR